MTSRNLFRAAVAGLLVLGVALPASAAPAPVKRRAAAAPVCDGSTALTVLGVDTSSGRMLLSLPALGEGGRAWLVEVAPDGAEALARPDVAAGRYGGSFGPGPVLAVRPCGPSCLQPLRWQEGAWEPLGEPLVVPVATTAGTTYDLTGAPWIVLHAAGSSAGRVKAWAFRLENREWKAKGALEITAVGDLQAAPAPQRKDGVLSGSGLFAASGKPLTWVEGLPNVPAERRGQVIALGGGTAAYLSGDGVIYLSPDSGKTWRRSTWTPWGRQEAAGLWRQGSDFWVDLPFGDRQGKLQLAWFDHRVPGQEKLFLTRLDHTGQWVSLAESKSEIRTRNGDRLPVSHVVVPREGRWALLSGCAATADGPGMVLRTWDGTLSEPRFVPIRAAGR